MHALLYGTPLSLDDLTATLTALTGLSSPEHDRSRR